MDIGYILLIPALLLAFYAQFKVKSTFKKYSAVQNGNGISGASVARMILDHAGVRDVTIEPVPGNLTDHYDPKTKTVRLSDNVYASTSLAAIGVAAHEVGHAIQHNYSYSPLAIRSSLFPTVSFGSKAAMPIFLIGMVLSYLGTLGSIGIYFIYAGIFLFSAVVLFQIITLPVEFNASSRAIELLGECGILTNEEIKPARKVLNAAALTYVAAAAMAIVQLIRLLLAASRRR